MNRQETLLSRIGLFLILLVVLPFGILFFIGETILRRLKPLWLRLKLRAYRGLWRVQQLLFGTKYRLSERDAAFCQAAIAGDAHNVRIFLQQGANANLRTAYGVPLLQRAAETGNAEIARLLLAARAQVNAACLGTRQTALMVAAMQGHTEMVRLLLSQGACLNAKDYSGNTALLLATKSGQEEIVQEIVTEAKFRGVLLEGIEDALTWAQQRKHKELRSLLMQGQDTATLLRPSQTPPDREDNLLKPSPAPCAPPALSKERLKELRS